MPYYQLVFNKPQIDSYTYYSEISIPILARVEAYLLSKKYIAIVIEETDPHKISILLQKDIRIKTIQRVIDNNPLLTIEQLKLAQWMSKYYVTSLGECLFTILPSAQREVVFVPSQSKIGEFANKAPVLTEDQESGVQEILKEYKKEKKRHIYISGITGSGKTEVFLKSAQYMIQQGKQVIYLVPEISLVIQNYLLFCKRFGKDNVAILHSGLTSSQRLKEWNRIACGDAHIILGVRSAIFAPVKKLSLIVIDEEHDTSYKSNSAPRYHARQVAFKRALLHNAIVAMASATPSLESYYHIKNGNFVSYHLSKRVGGGVMPHIQIVPMNHTIGCISPVLKSEMHNTLKKGKQVLLLLNRRGFSNTFLCEHCGSVIHCPHCSVHLVYHKEKNERKLCCHHCGHKEVIPDFCPSCGYVKLKVKGWGTQRVEEELKKILPQYVIGRLDSDVLVDKKGTEKILESFYKKDIHILIGTQMIAKGMNFPSLQLVGVLFADGMFSLPDFRANERAFSLLTQVSGRSGRFYSDGKVIIQTFMNNNPLLDALVQNKQDDFYDQELDRRKMFSLVPFCRIMRLVFRGKNEDKVSRIASDFMQEVQSFVKESDKDWSSHFTIVGPTACAISKLAQQYRIHVLLSSQSQKTLVTLVRSVLIEKKFQRKTNSQSVYVEIDPDPQWLM